jgi:hypothetical protein
MYAWEVGWLITILWLICAYHILRYSMGKGRSISEFIFYMAVLVLGSSLPWGWIGVLLVGAFCWADARAPD